MSQSGSKKMVKPFGFRAFSYQKKNKKAINAAFVVACDRRFDSYRTLIV